MTQTIVTVESGQEIAGSLKVMLNTLHGVDEVLIGRSKLCTVRVEQYVRDISRIQTWIWSNHGTAYVRDLNSFGGTTVNGSNGDVRILRGGTDVELIDGDTIIIGEERKLVLKVEVIE